MGSRWLRFSLTRADIGRALSHTLVAGTYTLSAMAYATSDFNGQENTVGDDWGTLYHAVLHSHWWAVGADRMNKGEAMGTTRGGFPSSRDVWEAVSVTFDAGSAPGNVSIYVGDPLRNTAGTLFVTDLQITRPDGSTILHDGHFPNGAQMAS